jgi:hypothetical protein
MKLKRDLPEPTLDYVSQFYGSQGGWRMFDGKLLTPDIENFLKSEAATLSSFVNRDKAYNHLIEVGCGYGRYLHWAVNSGLGYDGLELISWLAQMGQERVRNLDRTLTSRSIAITHGTANSIDFLLKDTFAKEELKPAILFPFNCFGNLSHPDLTLRASTKRCDTILISTFGTDLDATRTRSHYYVHCGYQNVTAKEVREGTLVTSEEGLKSYAYSSEALQTMMADYNFELKSINTFGRIGRFYVFCRQGVNASSNIIADREKGRNLFHETISVSLALLIEPAADSRLEDLTVQKFSDIEGFLLNFSGDQVEIQIENGYWPIGTLVKMDVHDLREFQIGQIIKVSSGTGTQSIVTIKFFDPDSTRMFYKLYLKGLS